MRVTNKPFALPRVIAFAGALLIGSPAFADIVLDVSNVDLQGNRTDVTLTVTAECDSTSNTSGNTGNVTVSIYQSVGRHVVIGTKTTTFTCSAVTPTQELQITVSLPQGNLKFQPGPATLYVSGFTTDAAEVLSPTFEIGEKVSLH